MEILCAATEIPGGPGAFVYTHIISHASVRNMMCCTVAGQGAGIAAAMSVKSGKSVQDVDITTVQTKLQRQGVRIQ